MASTDNPRNTPAENEGWLAYLDEEIKNIDADSPVRNDLQSILKKLFLSDCGTQNVADAARQIDSYYCNSYLNLYPVEKFNEGKIEHYLSTLYESIFALARSIGYEASRHDILIQLIQELRKLPVKPCMIWGEDSWVYSDEPIFGTLMYDDWAGTKVNDKHEQAAEKGCAQSKKMCEEWVNFASFLAQCIAGGLYPRSFSFNWPIYDIDDGLKEDVAEATRTPRPCRVMVAARYMLIAPQPLYDALIKYQGRDLGLEKWQFWAKRLKEIFDNDDHRPELRAATKEAREKMVSVDPALFFVSERGTKFDP